MPALTCARRTPSMPPLMCAGRTGRTGPPRAARLPVHSAVPGIPPALGFGRGGPALRRVRVVALAAERGLDPALRLGGGTLGRGEAKLLEALAYRPSGPAAHRTLTAWRGPIVRPVRTSDNA